LTFVDLCIVVQFVRKSPTRCNSVSKFYSIFIWSSTCFGWHTTHHQEPLKLHKQPLVLHTWKIVGGVVVGRCQVAKLPDNCLKMLSFDALSRTALTVCDVKTDELNLGIEKAAYYWAW